MLVLEHHHCLLHLNHKINLRAKVTTLQVNSPYPICMCNLPMPGYVTGFTRKHKGYNNNRHQLPMSEWVKEATKW